MTGRPAAAVVVALGGNALLRRGEPLDADHQRANVASAAAALAALAARPPDRRHARQRPAGRAARAAGRGLHRHDPVSARRARRRERGHDRLPDRAGARQPAAAGAPVATLLTQVVGRSRTTRPSRRPTQADRAGLRTRPRRAGWPPSAGGRSRRTDRASAGSCPRPSRWMWSSSRRSGCCSMPG